MDAPTMLLNRFETLMMNNPVRSAIHRHYEARRLRSMGGTMQGGRALEIGGGRGVGAEIILDMFGADQVDVFDLDPRMVALAQQRLSPRGNRVSVAVGDVTAIAAPDATYDAVFDFGIIHHVVDWQAALTEIHRVLKPGGRFFAEEVLARYIHNPVLRRLVDHPQEDRFDHERFKQALATQGFDLVASAALGEWFGFYVADKRR